jgi:xylulokinase
MLLGIDLGTGSVKALLLAIDGTIVAEASSPYPVQSPKPGWAETNPQDWWSAVAIAVKIAVGERAEQVAAIGLSGQMHGLVLANPDGQTLRPAILWADMRSSQVMDRYHALPFDSRSSLPTQLRLAWLVQPYCGCSSMNQISMPPPVGSCNRKTGCGCG